MRVPIAQRPLRLLDTFRTSGRSPSGAPLPPPALRAGGRHFASDRSFVEGGRRDARLLVERTGLNGSSTVLDIGCGAGRLAIGILEVVGSLLAYYGLDVRREVIEWDRRFLTRRYPWLRFEHVDVANERYNVRGQLSPASSRLPFGDRWFDAVYAYSVFSHMSGGDVQAYLSEMRRVLRPTGMGIFTAFVEDGVPEEAVNPGDYGPIAWEGALHCVRFRREYFEAMVHRSGLEVMALDHGRETDRQSLFVVAPMCG